MILDLIIGFVIGKSLAAFIDSYLVMTTFSGSIFFEDFLSEFNIRLVSMNPYHIVLGVIVGLILVVWRSEGIFE